MNKISVIIPMYNSKNYIEECLDSVLSQKFDSLEIIIVDDYSKDDSVEIASKVFDKYKFENFKIIKNEENLGVSSSRNIGLENSDSKYIMFLDSDDMLSSNALGNLYERMEKDNLDILYFDAESFFESDELKEKFGFYSNYYTRKGKYPDVYTGKQLLALMHPNNDFRQSPCLLIIKRDFLLDNAIKFKNIKHEDNVYAFNLVLDANRVSHIGEKFYLRRIRNDSLVTSAKNFSTVRGLFKGYLYMLDDYNSRNINKKYEKILNYEINRILKRTQNTYNELDDSEKQKYIELSENERKIFEVKILNKKQNKNVNTYSRPDSEERFAAYVAGDENIALGALVALHSFNKYHPEVDLYLYSYPEKIDKKYLAEFKKIGVNIIDITQYKSDFSKFAVFEDGDLSWPQEIFMNFLVPTLLKDKYDYVFKLDYDLLTIKRFNYEEIIPKNQVVLSSIYNPFNLYKQVAGDFKYYRKEFGVTKRFMRRIGINCGFLIINIKSFIKNDIFNEMQQIFNKLVADEEVDENNIYGDQSLISMVIGFYSLPYKIIDTGYNVTSITAKQIPSIYDCFNIHYTGSIKPWKFNELDYENIDTFNGANYFLNQVWRDYVKNNLPEFYNNSWEEESNVFLDIFMRINNNIFKLQSENHDLKKEIKIYKKDSKILENSRYFQLRKKLLGGK